MAPRPGRLLALGVAAALLSGGAFVQPAPRQRLARTRRLASGGKDAGGYEYQPFNLLFTFPSEEELLQVINSVPDVNSIWPDPEVSLSREAFKKAVKARAKGPVSEAACDVLFNSFSAASGFLVPESRQRVTDEIGNWRSSPSEQVTSIGLGAQVNMLASRLWILGAWLFLNVFTVYATYFVILRPFIYQQFGIDFVQSAARWWEVE